MNDDQNAFQFMMMNGKIYVQVHYVTNTWLPIVFTERFSIKQLSRLDTHRRTLPRAVGHDRLFTPKID